MELQTNLPSGFKNVLPLTATVDLQKVIEALPTPNHSQFYQDMLKRAAELDATSKYPCNFDYKIYDWLEKRLETIPHRGQAIFKGAFKLVNHHYSCQECLYSFMVDTYGRGCAHDCLYCYSRAELVVHAWWNRPFAMPVDINEVRDLFYTTFETDKKTKWRKIMEQKIPLRIGYASDSFMGQDKKYKITQELLNILKFYRYPYIIATKSDLIGDDEYLNLMDKDLCSIQMSLSSTNESIVEKIEPGAPSPKRRLMALKRAADAGYWTTARLNPLFPIHADGYFTDPSIAPDKKEYKLNIFTWDTVDEIASYGIPSLIAGFGRFSAFAINQLDKALGTDLRQFYNGKKFQNTRDYHYSDAEIRYYYERIKERCKSNGIEFTTCYIGNGEPFFWKDQDLWDNKHDCCNAKNRVSAFKADAHGVPYQDRLKFCTSSCGKQPTPQRQLINIQDHLPKGVNSPFLGV